MKFPRIIRPGDGARRPLLPMARAGEWAVTGAFRYANTWPEAIELAASGRIDLDGLVTGHFGLDEVEGALTAGQDDPESIKVVVRPNQ